MKPAISKAMFGMTSGKVRGVGVTKYMLAYSRKNETPIAVISSEMRGA